jgi:hypothetical protein
MRRAVYFLIMVACLVIAVLAWQNAFAADCTDDFKPDIKALKKLQPVYQMGDQITVTGNNQNTQAEIIKIVPWWDSTDCTWKVNYEAEVKNVFRFSEGDPNVKLAQPGGRK